MSRRVRRIFRCLTALCWVPRAARRSPCKVLMMLSIGVTVQVCNAALERDGAMVAARQRTPPFVVQYPSEAFEQVVSDRGMDHSDF